MVFLPSSVTITTVATVAVIIPARGRTPATRASAPAGPPRRIPVRPHGGAATAVPGLLVAGLSSIGTILVSGDTDATVAGGHILRLPC